MPRKRPVLPTPDDPMLPRKGAAEAIVHPGGRALSPARLEARCLGALSRLVETACTWEPPDSGSWKVGDFNILVVETEMAPGLPVFLQFWSEPMEPVLCEVSSGWLNKPVRRLISGVGRAALAARGYTVGGNARNYQREMDVRKAEDARELAREVLAILTEVFGYRGHTPLRAEIQLGERAGRDIVHHSLTSEDVLKLLSGMGFCASLEVENGQPCVTVGLESHLFHVFPTVKAEGQNLYAALDLVTPIAPADSSCLGILNDINARARFIKVVHDGSGTILARSSMRLDGGVTRDTIARTIRQFASDSEDVRRELAVAGWKEPAEDGGRRSAITGPDADWEEEEPGPRGTVH